MGISKRGNTYLRKILVHGARAAVYRIKRDHAPIGAWMDALERRAHKNVLIVAFANKLARIAWAVLSSGEPGNIQRTIPARSLFWAEVRADWAGKSAFCSAAILVSSSAECDRRSLLDLVLAREHKRCAL